MAGCSRREGRGQAGEVAGHSSMSGKGERRGWGQDTPFKGRVVKGLARHMRNPREVRELKM